MKFFFKCCPWKVASRHIPLRPPGARLVPPLGLSFLATYKTLSPHFCPQHKHRDTLTNGTNKHTKYLPILMKLFLKCCPWKAGSSHISFRPPTTPLAPPSGSLGGVNGGTPSFLFSWLSSTQLTDDKRTDTESHYYLHYLCIDFNETSYSYPYWPYLLSGITVQSPPDLLVPVK